MNTLNWKPTFDSPEVTLTQYNILSICGKSLMEDAYSFYQPIIKKIQYSTESSLNIELDIKMLNSGSKKQLFKLLDTARENANITDIRVFWMSDPADEDSYDLGKELESISGIPFDFFEFA